MKKPISTSSGHAFNICLCTTHHLDLVSLQSLHVQKELKLSKYAVLNHFIISEKVQSFGCQTYSILITEDTRSE